MIQKTNTNSSKIVKSIDRFSIGEAMPTQDTSVLIVQLCCTGGNRVLALPNHEIDSAEMTLRERITTQQTWEKLLYDRFLKLN